MVIIMAEEKNKEDNVTIGLNDVYKKLETMHNHSFLNHVIMMALISLGVILNMKENDKNQKMLSSYIINAQDVTMGILEDNATPVDVDDNGTTDYIIGKTIYFREPDGIFWTQNIDEYRRFLEEKINAAPEHNKGIEEKLKGLSNKVDVDKLKDRIYKLEKITSSNNQ